MIKTKVTIINKLGLHARAAAKFATTSTRFASNIQTGINDKMVDGKSVMAVMLLAASKGTELNLEINGEDEQEAQSALLQLINNRFDEEE